MRIVPFVVAASIAAIACGGSTAPASTSISCKQTVDAYCVNANPTCAKKIDPSNVVDSFCAGTNLATSFGTSQCTGRTNVDSIVSDDVRRVYSYDSTTGALVAIYDTDAKTQTVTCVAGPAPFTPPSPCYSNLVAYQCGMKLDGGADSARD